MSLAVVIDTLDLLALGVWNLLLFTGIFLLALVFLFSSMLHVSERIGVCCFLACDPVLYFCATKGNGICLLVVDTPSWKRVQLLKYFGTPLILAERPTPKAHHNAKARQHTK